MPNCPKKPPFSPIPDGSLQCSRRCRLFICASERVPWRHHSGRRRWLSVARSSQRLSFRAPPGGSLDTAPGHGRHPSHAPVGLTSSVDTGVVEASYVILPAIKAARSVAVRRPILLLRPLPSTRACRGSGRSAAMPWTVPSRCRLRNRASRNSTRIQHAAS